MQDFGLSPCSAQRDVDPVGMLRDWSTGWLSGEGMPLTDCLVEQQTLGDAEAMQQDIELLFYLLTEALEALDASRDVCGGNHKPARVGAAG